MTHHVIDVILVAGVTKASITGQPLARARRSGARHQSKEDRCEAFHAARHAARRDADPDARPARGERQSWTARARTAEATGAPCPACGRALPHGSVRAALGRSV